MGKLNSSIKMAAHLLNSVLLLFGLGLLGAGTYLITSDFVQLGDGYLTQIMPFVIASGALLVFITVIGCCGTCHQIEREGCGGRKLLGFYQLVMVATLVGQGIFELWLSRVEQNMTTAAAELPDVYGTFEADYRDSINTVYFAGQCSRATAFGASTVASGWMWTLVDQRCNTTMDSSNCYCEGVTTTSCQRQGTYDGDSCCPEETLCTAGLTDACPYDRCREPLIQYVLGYISPIATYLTFVLAVEAAALVLTCLLLCYNPRDTVEDMLWKTGVLAHRDDDADDVEPGEASGTSGSRGGGGGSNIGSKRRGSKRVTEQADPEEPEETEEEDQEELLIQATPPMSPRNGGGGSGGMDDASLPSTPLRQFQSPRGGTPPYRDEDEGWQGGGGATEVISTPMGSPGSRTSVRSHSSSPRSPTPLLFPVKRASGQSHQSHQSQASEGHFRG